MYSRNELIQLKNSGGFTCPTCNEPVQMKVGSKKIPHFSHLPSNMCNSRFSENESSLHLLGKIKLQQFFLSQNYSVQIEALLKKISQRPDLLIIKDNKKIAVEFQISTIQQEQWHSRTAGYKNENIQVQWILCQKVHERQAFHSLIRISVSHFQRLFIHNNSLMLYYPQNNEFIYYSNLYYIGGNQYLAKKISLNDNYQIYPFRQPLPLTEDELKLIALMWKKYKRKYMEQLFLRNKKGISQRILFYCYELRINPLQLPDYIGILIAGNEVMNCSPIEWQIAYLHYLVQSTVKNKKNFLMNFMNNKFDDKHIMVLDQYEKILSKLNVISASSHC